MIFKRKQKMSVHWLCYTKDKEFCFAFCSQNKALNKVSKETNISQCIINKHAIEKHNLNDLHNIINHKARASLFGVNRPLYITEWRPWNTVLCENRRQAGASTWELWQTAGWGRLVIKTAELSEGGWEIFKWAELQTLCSCEGWAEVGRGSSTNFFLWNLDSCKKTSYDNLFLEIDALAR